MAGESWLWFFEWTPAFLGSGMLVGLNVGMSALAGSILAWGIIGPSIVASGAAAGLQAYKGTKWEPYTIYVSLDPGTTPGTLPSPRFWLLWPGIMIMLCSSVAEMAVQYKVIYRMARSAIEILMNNTRGISGSSMKRSIAGIFQSSPEESDDDEVKWWMWVPGTILLIIVSCIVLYYQYHMDVGSSIITLVFGFIFAFVTVQCQGAAEISPTSAVTKVVQLILGGVVNQGNASLKTAQMVNIAGAQVAGGAGYASAELMADLRVGFLLRTPFKQQLTAQLLGNVVAVFLSPLVFILFATAYPCIMNYGDRTCAFQVPAAAAWSGIASVVTSEDFPVPTSSAITALALGILSAVLIVVRTLYLVGDRQKYRVWVPNMAVVGLMFVLPSTCYSIVSSSFL
jgi:uncharacterized oligopeptide transporter (OPT) family protein